jgi:hypothetical protein
VGACAHRNLKGSPINKNPLNVHPNGSEREGSPCPSFASHRPAAVRSARKRVAQPCLSVFSVGDHIRDWNLHRDIILFYLSGLFRILVCPKGFLLWALIGTEKVGMRSSGLSGYSVGSHLYILHFVIFTGCGHLTLGWYNVGSHLFPICQFTSSYILLAIWQLKA